MAKDEKKNPKLSDELSYNLRMEIHLKVANQNNFGSKTCFLCSAAIVDVPVFQEEPTGGIDSLPCQGLLCTVCNYIMHMELYVVKHLERKPDDRW